MSRQRPSKQQHAEPPRFSIRLQPSTGLTRRQEEAFERQLAEYLAAREMTAEGTQLRMDIRSLEREIGARDLAELSCWAMEQPAIGAIHVSMVGVIPTRATGSWATASCSDRAVEPLVQLYRMGRISAAIFFEVLASFQPGSLE